MGVRSVPTLGKLVRDEAKFSTAVVCLCHLPTHIKRYAGTHTLGHTIYTLILLHIHTLSLTCTYTNAQMHSHTNRDTLIHKGKLKESKLSKVNICTSLHM